MAQCDTTRCPAERLCIPAPLQTQDKIICKQFIYSSDCHLSPVDVDLKLCLVSIYFCFVLCMDKAAADPQKVFINSSLVKFLFLINYALEL